MKRAEQKKRNLFFQLLFLRHVNGQRDAEEGRPTQKWGCVNCRGLCQVRQPDTVEDFWKCAKMWRRWRSMDIEGRIKQQAMEEQRDGR